MALTVYAEKLGFWHRGSGGFGVAPLDVCLSPPPGPVPVPYTNFLKAEDLVKGSKTVRIDGEPTALEDYSETSTSTGDEGGTLGGSVVTGVILGKGYFMVWSMTVYVEGRGVARHGDMMGQNSAIGSSPPSAIDAAAVCGHANPTAPVPAPVAEARAARAKVLEATGPGDSQPVEPAPCDFETIVLRCGHGKDGDERRGKSWTFRYDGRIRDDLSEPSPDDPVTTNIQLTAGSTSKGADVLSVEITGGPGYGCSKQHPLVVLTDRSDPSVEKIKRSGETKVELALTSLFEHPPAFTWMSLAAVLTYYWFSPKTTRTYRLEVASCGVLADHSPGFRKLSRTIEVFSSDVFKLGVAFPPAIAKARETGGPFNLEDVDERTAYQRDAPVKAVAAEVGESFTFERNGEDFSSHLEVGKIVETLIRVRDATASILDGVKGLTVGVKPICEVEFFSGSLSIEWGAREWRDQRVFAWWKVEAALTILKAKIGVGYGVELFTGRFYEVTALVEGTLTGEVPLQASTEARPQDKPNFQVAASGKVTGAITVTGQLGDRWLYVKGEVNAAIVAEATLALIEAHGPRLDWKVKWTGLKVVGDVHSKVWGVVTSVEHTLIDGKVLGEGNLFGGP